MWPRELVKSAPSALHFFLHSPFWRRINPYYFPLRNYHTLKIFIIIIRVRSRERGKSARVQILGGIFSLIPSPSPHLRGSFARKLLFSESIYYDPLHPPNQIATGPEDDVLELLFFSTSTEQTQHKFNKSFFRPSATGFLSWADFFCFCVAARSFFRKNREKTQGYA